MLFVDIWIQFFQLRIFWDCLVCKIDICVCDSVTMYCSLLLIMFIWIQNTTNNPTGCQPVVLMKNLSAYATTWWTASSMASCNLMFFYSIPRLSNKGLLTTIQRKGKYLPKLGFFYFVYIHNTHFNSLFKFFVHLTCNLLNCRLIIDIATKAFKKEQLLVKCFWQIQTLPRQQT